MGSLTNNLKGLDAQRQVVAVACGRHNVRGHLWLSYSTGAAPNHQVFGRQVLGEGDWEGIESAYYELPGGTKVLPASNFIFHDGSQTDTGAYFSTDTAHTGTVMLDFKLEVGDSEPDTAATPPDGLIVIAKTEKFPDFDEDGNQINSAGAIVAAYGAPLVKSAFFYTVNPARVLVGWLFKYGRIKASRINWLKWTQWRDYLAEIETVDYTGIEDFPGFGLTGSYYNGTNFETLVVSRLDPSVYFAPSAGAPAPNVNPDNFSAKWEGFIKAKYTETTAFTLVHTNGARLTVGGTVLIDQFVTDGSTASGTHSATKDLTAGEYYPVLIEWNGGTGTAEIAFKWSSPSIPIEVVPFESMYPKSTTKSRYEAHLDFSTPTTLDRMIETVLFVSNSIRQDVEGKLEFYCVEQLEDTFHFDDTLPEEERLFIDGTFTFERSDVRINDRQNVWEANFLDLDSQYLEKPITPLIVRVQSLIDISGREITGTPVELLGNMTRWQALKVLRRFVNLAVVNDLVADFDATGRMTSFKSIAGDVGRVTHRKGNFVNKRFQVVESIDYSPEETADKKKFRLKEI